MLQDAFLGDRYTNFIDARAEFRAYGEFADAMAGGMKGIMTATVSAVNAMMFGPIIIAWSSFRGEAKSELEDNSVEGFFKTSSEFCGTSSSASLNYI